MPASHSPNDPPPPMRPYYRFARFVSQLAFTCYFRGRVLGRENVPRRGGVMLASNHQSFFDPIAVSMSLPRECNYMARDTLFTNPFFGRLIASLNAFPVKRGVGDVGAVKEILRRLKDGKVVTVFVEGTRTTDGNIGPLNVNTLTLAQRAGAAIVPTVIEGAFDAWPRNNVLPRPWPLAVVYEAPLLPEQCRDWPAERLAETVRQRLDQAMARARALLDRSDPMHGRRRQGVRSITQRT